MVEGHRPRKRFGQNFLVDQNIVHQIVAAIAPGENDNLVEIGPGQGAITGPLLAAGPGLQAIELDRDLAAGLRLAYGNNLAFQLHEGDALAFDFKTLALPGRPLRILGNLPYNISTPLLFHLLRFENLITDMHFMLQREVVDRLVAGPGSKSYGRLGIVVQYHCQVERLFDVPPDAFNPPPRVNSAIVRLAPHRQKPVTARNPKAFAELVNRCFQQRRKTLRNTLKHFADPDSLAGLAVDLQARPETLTVAEFVHLSNQLETTP